MNPRLAHSATMASSELIGGRVSKPPKKVSTRGMAEGGMDPIAGRVGRPAPALRPYRPLTAARSVPNGPENGGWPPDSPPMRGGLEPESPYVRAEKSVVHP